MFDLIFFEGEVKLEGAVVMAMMDDLAFLVSHIRNSFITSDETGMSELIIDAEDNLNRPANSPEKRPTTWHGSR